MNRTEEIKLLEQLEQWNSKDEYSQCIQAIEAIPEQERGYLLTVKLSRAYSNLAVLGDHGVHGTDGEVDEDLIRHAIDLLESVRTQGENDPYWNSRMGYSCLMAYRSAATAYEYAKCWLALAPDDPAAQKLVRDCEGISGGGKALELDLKEREEIIRKETPDDVKGVSVNEQWTDHSILQEHWYIAWVLIGAVDFLIGAIRNWNWLCDPTGTRDAHRHSRGYRRGFLSAGCPPDCGEYLGICAEIEIGGAIP